MTKGDMMAKAKDKAPTVDQIDKAAAKFKPTTATNAGILGAVAGLARVKAEARLLGIDGSIINLLLPFIIEQLRKYGPAAVDALVEWLKKRFGVQ
jgi:hypothetical protein